METETNSQRLQKEARTDVEQQWIKRDLLKQLLGIGGIGLGAGVLAGSLKGLLTSDTAKYDPLLHTSPISTPIPILAAQERDAEKRRIASAKHPEAAKLTSLLPAVKTAKLDQAPPAGPLQSAADMLPDVVASDPSNSQYMLPLGILAGVLPFFGGYSLMNSWTKSRQKNRLEDDLDASRRDFQQALANQYRQAMRGKTASEESDFDRRMNALADAYCPEAEKQAGEKRANSNPLADFHNMLLGLWPGDLPEQMKGLLWTTLLGSGALGAYGAYQYTKSHTPAAAAAKAIKLRSQQRRLAPVAPVAIPVSDESKL